jgi:hypothetical protein
MFAVQAAAQARLFGVDAATWEEAAALLGRVSKEAGRDDG